jgi:hypothetical protein
MLETTIDGDLHQVSKRPFFSESAGGNIIVQSEELSITGGGVMCEASTLAR